MPWVGEQHLCHIGLMGNWWSLMGKYHLGNDFATSWSHYKSVLPQGSWRAYNPTPTRRSLKHCGTGTVALGRCQKSSSGPTASFFLGLLWWNPNYTLGNRPCSLNIWFDHGEPRGHWECWAAANSWLPMKLLFELGHTWFPSSLFFFCSFIWKI